MSGDVLRRLRGLELADVGQALDDSDRTETLLGELPSVYAAALRIANGFTVHSGMNRVFGIRADRHMDLRSWNEEEGWRFAWGGKADPSFLMFGETAFGDQYALRWTGSSYEDVVYLLDVNLLSVRPIFDSFAHFLDQEIVQNALSPSHPVAVACVGKFGRVSPDENVVLTPSLLLGGYEDVSNMVKIESYTAMIYGGDIYTAVVSAPDEAAVVGVEPWVDDVGRQRLRVVFAEEA
ncbi:SMI1/KNR4 family protein [Micromonospora sp. NBC_01796]|uniref:SMI1/KNR4 family protein n=1 Tax=Micromonospora sp. NBC_01796 TaxID=2975987 RepID=UPI002DD7D6E0|nr:SMI1/KNR4 family protein [Micromonospora sp. NBC_01796]WSA82978.1 SMI1/KNR4 family protein [Micromonospora sp. NBC_01796]